MWVLAFLEGCSNSGLDRSAADTGDSEPPVSIEDCPWVGEWQLEAVKCGGTFDYGSWYETHEGATLTLAHQPEGGCTVALTVRGASCLRTEEGHLALPVGTDAAYTSAGISGCEPSGCRFLPEEPECAPGGLAGETTVRMEDLGGTLTAVHLLRNTIPEENCPLDIYTTWKPGRR